MAALGTAVQAGSGTGYWRTYDTTDGLACNMVLMTYQVPEGGLWIVTHLGISRFDGKTFSTFSLPGNFPHKTMWPLLQDRNGHLWVNSHAGLARFDGSSFSTYSMQDGLPHPDVREILEDCTGRLWIRFGAGGLSVFDRNQFTTFTARDGLPHGMVTAMAQDSGGTLWFGTPEGLVRFCGDHFSAHITENGLFREYITTLKADQIGGLWAGTRSGLFYFNQKSCASYTQKDGLPHDLINHIFQDKKGNIWITFSPDDVGLTRFDGKSFTTYGLADGLLDCLIRPFFLDSQENLWIGTLGGLNLFDGKSFTGFTTQNGLPHNNVQSISEDAEGHLWVGTCGGLAQYFGRTFTHFTMKDGLAHNDVWTMQEDRNGHLWFGTNGGGASCYDGKKFITYTTQDGLPNNKVLSIIQDRKGNLWFGTRGGACRFDGNAFHTFTTKDGLPSNVVWRISEDRHGRIWFGTNKGEVTWYDGQKVVSFSSAKEKIPQAVWEMVEDTRGDFWLGTHYNGIFRYQGGAFHPFAQDLFQKGWACAIFQDREGNLWFGTQHSGVVRYDGKSFLTFSREDGLADNWVCSISQDREGHLWFGTCGGGVSRFDGEIFQTLTQRDGLTGNVIYSILQDRMGDFWFCTSHGVTRYHPTSTSSPPVFIESVIADRRYKGADEIEIPDSTQLIAFEFHATSLKTRPGAMVYQYRLDGIEKAWKTTVSGRVEYQGLPLGTFCFEVRAIDQNLNYSRSKMVKFHIVPDPRIVALIEALNKDGSQGELVGASVALRRVEMQLSEVAQTNLNILILGETGTGKGLAAHAVHALSSRKSGPFIQINCGAIPEGLVESELFGHERGAFTGAVLRKLGKVELARGGTLFLDEVGDLSKEAQAKLLRLLEERTYERVGGTKTMKADVQVIAATNRDLSHMVEEGSFREDLYFRLSTFSVRMPPLRERVEDIPLLATYFMERMNEHIHKPVTQLAPDAISALQAYDWPGNVRELEHAIQRAMIACHGSVIRAKDITLGLGKIGEVMETTLPTMEEHLKAYERRYLQTILDKTGWVIRGRAGAATLLGIPESTLRYRMKKLGIEKG